MRNGILWAVTCLLASASLVWAQPNPAPLGAPVLPDAVAAQEPKKADLVPPQTTVFQPAAPTPLRYWVTTDYLLWWTKAGPLNTPLVTTGSLPDIPPGALGQPSTQVGFGDKPMSYGALSGVRLGAGVDLGGGLAVEGNYFALTTGALHYSAASDANGYPRITRPFYNNQFSLPDALGVSEPSALIGPWTGSIGIASHSQLQGWELNASVRQRLSNEWDFCALAGFRSLSLDEDLSIQESLGALVPGVLTFLSPVPNVNAGDTLTTFDRFHTSNNFFGGQIGGRLEYYSDGLTVSMVGKIAFGVNQQVATIDGGSSWLTPGGGVTTAPGGVLALPSNMGRYYRSSFSVVPEAGLNVAYNITPRVKATVGYNFMYWTNVARPGAQIDANLNPATMPTNQLFGNGQGGTRPVFSFQGSDYWAQGISLGLEFKF
jgi:hypothetical protein